MTYRVALICHNATFGRAMAKALTDTAGIDLVGVLAIHRPASRRTKLKRWFDRTFRTPKRERQVRRIEARLAQEADKVFAEKARPPAEWPATTVLKLTADPNGTDATGWLSGLELDLLAVTGAPILRQPVFSLPKYGTLNMHSSLLPAYRGTQAEFWQVTEDRLDTCGITVHFIDEGVDTGGIVVQQPTEITSGTSPQMVRTYNLLQALQTVPEAVLRVLNKTATITPQTGGERARRAKERTIECRVALLQKLGHLGESKEH